MKTSERIVDFMRKSFETALYFATMAVKEDFRNYVRRAGPTPSPETPQNLEAINPTATHSTSEQATAWQETASPVPQQNIELPQNTLSNYSTSEQATAEQGKPNPEVPKAKEPKQTRDKTIAPAEEGGAQKRKILILGNGPSLATDLPKIIEAMNEPATVKPTTSEPATSEPAMSEPAMSEPATVKPTTSEPATMKTTTSEPATVKPAPKDVMVVNYFAFDERFEVVQPAYYVLSDPVFFRESNQRERVLQLYETIARKVTWPMTLYVQYYNPEKFDYRAHLPNDNIRIVRFHSQLYIGFRKIRFALFKRGLGSGNFGTVVQVGEYIAMLLGYKEIELYGVDHTLFDGLFVDEENHLLRRTSYYYDDKPAEAKPLIHSVPYGPYTMASFLAENAMLFRGHELLKEYADHIGVRIINRTKGSLIDAYDRG